VPSLAEYRLEAFQALDTFWFIQAVEEIDHTDVTLSLRLQIRAGLFVQVFVGEITGALNFALVDGDTRIFGLDFHRGRWHVHPFGEVTAHSPYDGALEPTPLHRFLVLVGSLLLQHNIL
jgi:hypothetical protein